MDALPRLYNVEYPLDRTKDQLVQRGLIDSYDQSDNPGEWAVLQEYLFWSARFQVFIQIPRWFTTDLASIPRLFRRVISVNERHRLAALPHDFGYWLCRYHPDRNPFSRKEWDLIFKDFCEMQGVAGWKITLMYAALRCGGWYTFNKAPLPEEYAVAEQHRTAYINWFPSLDLPDFIGNFGVFK